MNRRKLLQLGLCSPILLWAPVRADDKPEPATYSKTEILQAIERFFGKGAKGLGEVVEKAFRDNGRPNAYIAGSEFSAALGVGVRYGKGVLKTKDGYSRKVYWQGPSIGFDAGGNVSKVFILIYNLPAVADIFQRFPGVEGSLFFVGGVGMNYLQSGKTVLAPIRFGAGWRQGVNVGYMDFTREMSLNPF
ncbi:MAG TPA: DUF1134 domain-containing protein [Gammaproteobacteria bacterium]|nr:DUF1134 domain-containing protein [Gammaproteobacteria bacterium]